MNDYELIECTLPDRQLRNFKKFVPVFKKGTLPDRQLRNNGSEWSTDIFCTLPDRQLRKSL